MFAAPRRFVVPSLVFLLVAHITTAAEPPIGPAREGTREVIETFPEDKLKTATAAAPGTSPFRLASHTSSAPGKLRVYFGTYTRPMKSEGIYRSELDLATGTLSEPVLAGQAVNPSFIAIHPSYNYVYAVVEGGGPPREKGEPPAAGSVVAYSVDPSTGDLKPLNAQSSGGSGPCHVSVDTTGRFVFVANYGGGSCGVLPIRDDGSLGEMVDFEQYAPGGTAEKPAAPRGHSINVDPSNRIAIGCDAGTDKVMIYRFDAATGTLTPAAPAFLSPGELTAPRHSAFHPNGKSAYVINERSCSMTAYAFDAEKGTLTELQTISTLPEGLRTGSATAEVVVHPSGKFLYGSNRGHNSIVTFAIDETTGKLTLVGHQGEGITMPRNFNVDPTGKYALVANQNGDSVIVFAIDPHTGALTKNLSSIALSSPVCIKFVPLAH